MALWPEETEGVCLMLMPPALLLLQKSEVLFFSSLFATIHLFRERGAKEKKVSWFSIVSLEQMNSISVQMTRQVHVFLVWSQPRPTDQVGCSGQGVFHWFCSVLPYLPRSCRSRRRCLCPASLSADCRSLWAVEQVPSILRHPSGITEYLELFSLMPDLIFNF